MKKRRLSQRQKEWLIVLALFLASTAFRFLVGDFPRRIRVYPDEARYVAIGESIAAGRGLTVRSQPTYYQKVLYSLLLASLHVVGDRWLRMHLLALVQAAVMSSGVVPLYLLGRGLIKDRKRLYAACALYVLSADLVLSMTLMSEVLFMPLGMWCVWGFYRLIVYQGSARKRRLLCAALGVGVYILYLDKEIAPVFLLAYALYAAVRLAYPATFGDGYTAENRAEIRAAWGDLALMTAAFFLPFLLMKLTVFRGLGGSYHQSSLDVLLLPGRARFMLYGFVHYLCGAVIAAGCLPLVLPLAFPDRLEDRAKKLLLFLLNLLVISAAVVAYTITVREDFGKLPRPIFRYICYLFPALAVVFFHQTEHTGGIGRKRFFGVLLGAGLLVFTLCWFWQGERDVSTNDHMLLKYLTGTPQDNLMLIVLLWGVILLTGMALFVRRPGLTLCVYLAAISVVQVLNNAYMIPRYRFENSITDPTYTEINELSRLLDGYDGGNILLIPGGQYDREVFDTYMNLPNFYVTDFPTLAALQGEEGIDLREQRIPGTPQDMDSVDLMILPRMYAFDSDAPELVRAGDKKVLNYNVYDMKHAAVLPPLRSLWQIHTGENVFDVTPEHFSSNFDPTDGRFTAYAGNNYLLYGPDLTLPAGDYDIVFEYRYEGDVPPGERLGRAELNSRNLDLTAYREPLLSGETSVTLRDVRIPSECDGFETKLWVNVPGVTATRLRIVKK